MAKITKRESRSTEVMVPYLIGDSLEYRPETIESSFGWRCDVCGLVWEKKWHAETCDQRQHQSTFTQHYPRFVREGNRYVDVGDTYTRKAIRKESLTSVA